MVEVVFVIVDKVGCLVWFSRRDISMKRRDGRRRDPEKSLLTVSFLIGQPARGLRPTTRTMNQLDKTNLLTPRDGMAHCGKLAT